MNQLKRAGDETHLALAGIALLVLVFTILGISLPARAETKKFKPAPGGGTQTFAVREPVLRVQPGDIVETETLYGGYYEKAGGKWPGEVGPFYIEGAAPGDTLVVKIVRLHPNVDHAVSTHTPGGISAVASDRYTRMLNEPIPQRRYVWKIEKDGTVGVLDLPDSKKRVEVPLRPMLGRVAVAPDGEEAWGGLWPGNFGGNMDASDVGQGATVYLPVFHEGAYFYFGDVHALQGDGEICGSGLETTAEVTFQFDLIKGKKIAWPRIENGDYIMTVGSVRPLSDALRIAAVEMMARCGLRLREIRRLPVCFAARRDARGQHGRPKLFSGGEDSEAPSAPVSQLRMLRAAERSPHQPAPVEAI